MSPRLGLYLLLVVLPLASACSKGGGGAATLSEQMDRALSADAFVLRAVTDDGATESVRVTPEGGRRVVAFSFSDVNLAEPIPYTAAHADRVRLFVSEWLTTRLDTNVVRWRDRYRLEGGGETLAFEAPFGRMSGLLHDLVNVGRGGAAFVSRQPEFELMRDDSLACDDGSGLRLRTYALDRPPHTPPIFTPEMDAPFFPSFVAHLQWHGREALALPVPTLTGERYIGKGVEFWGRSDEGVLDIEGEVRTMCRVVPVEPGTAPRRANPRLQRTKRPAVLPRPTARAYVAPHTRQRTFRR